MTQCSALDINFCYFQRVATKDFTRENRGLADVESFTKQAQVLLDVHETNLERILDRMVGAALEKEPPSTSLTAEDAKQEIFTHDRGNDSKLVRIIT